MSRRLHLHAAWDDWAAHYLCSLERQGASLRKVSKPRKQKKRKDYAFRHQFHEKPSVIPGCP